jgi:mRNA-degrading endonuclease HigB of HigAB toxin-antitoxin module
MYKSQDGIDRFLNDTFFQNKTDGTYVEIGALNGVINSPTYFFEKSLGWTGLLVEPHPLMYTFLSRYRSKINIISNSVISNSTDSVLYTYILFDQPGISGIVNTMPNEQMNIYNNSNVRGTYNAEPVSLTNLILSTNYSSADFMIIHVSGHEYEVVLSWDFSIPIDIIMIMTYPEFSDNTTKIQEYVVSHGYNYTTTFANYDVFIRTGSIYDSPSST